MITLLADANIQGQVAALVARMQSESWRDFWDHLQLRHVTFADVGLQLSAADDVVWQRCQEKGFLLLTDNRNLEDADSLEASIRAHNTAQSLPVFTIGDSKAILTDSNYAERVVDPWCPTAIAR